MSQVWRRSEVGNHKRRTLNTRLSSGTSEHTSSSSRNVPGGMIWSDSFWYWNNVEMKPTFGEKTFWIIFLEGSGPPSSQTTKLTKILSFFPLLNQHILRIHLQGQPITPQVSFPKLQAKARRSLLPTLCEKKSTSFGSLLWSQALQMTPQVG